MTAGPLRQSIISELSENNRSSTLATSGPRVSRGMIYTLAISKHETFVSVDRAPSPDFGAHWLEIIQRRPP